MSDVFALGQGVDADDMSLSKMCTDQPMNEVNRVINTFSLMKRAIISGAVKPNVDCDNSSLVHRYKAT